ncbi:MAG: hypothetical protein H6679_00220 [Epsilonproteobacteria bacterium]|nr:hypothetical protein [Campylobacterota bacterium]
MQKTYKALFACLFFSFLSLSKAFCAERKKPHTATPITNAFTAWAKDSAKSLISKDNEAEGTSYEDVQTIIGQQTPASLIEEIKQHARSGRTISEEDRNKFKQELAKDGLGVLLLLAWDKLENLDETTVATLVPYLEKISAPLGDGSSYKIAEKLPSLQRTLTRLSQESVENKALIAQFIQELYQTTPLCGDAKKAKKLPEGQTPALARYTLKELCDKAAEVGLNRTTLADTIAELDLDDFAQIAVGKELAREIGKISSADLKNPHKRNELKEKLEKRKQELEVDLKPIWEQEKQVDDKIKQAVTEQRQLKKRIESLKREANRLRWQTWRSRDSQPIRDRINEIDSRDIPECEREIASLERQLNGNGWEEGLKSTAKRLSEQEPRARALLSQIGSFEQYIDLEKRKAIKESVIQFIRPAEPEDPKALDCSITEEEEKEIKQLLKECNKDLRQEIDDLITNKKQQDFNNTTLASLTLEDDNASLRLALKNSDLLKAGFLGAEVCTAFFAFKKYVALLDQHFLSKLQSMPDDVLDNLARLAELQEEEFQIDFYNTERLLLATKMLSYFEVPPLSYQMIFIGASSILQTILLERSEQRQKDALVDRLGQAAGKNKLMAASIKSIMDGKLDIVSKDSFKTLAQYGMPNLLPNSSFDDKAIEISLFDLFEIINPLFLWPDKIVYRSWKQINSILLFGLQIWEQAEQDKDFLSSFTPYLLSLAEMALSDRAGDVLQTWGFLKAAEQHNQRCSTALINHILKNYAGYKEFLQKQSVVDHKQRSLAKKHFIKAVEKTTHVPFMTWFTQYNLQATGHRNQGNLLATLILFGLIAKNIYKYKTSNGR